MRKIEVTQEEGYEVPFEVMAKSIEQISRAMQAISKTRIKEETLITLIAAQTKIGRDKIRFVLNCLNQLETIYLKPAPTKGKK